MNAPTTPPAFVRPSWKTSLEGALSYSTKTLLQAYRMARGTEFYVEVPDLPPTVNHSQRAFFNGKKGKIGIFKDPRVEAFRKLVDVACWRREFKPRAAVGCVIVFESPLWVTKEYKIRQRDVDNPVKAVLDALQRSLAFDDSCIWEVHSAKIFSRRNATHVWLFDLGDVVTAIGGQSLLKGTTP